MFRRRWHQYIVVYLHNKNNQTITSNREVTTSRKLDISLMGEVKRQICENDNFNQDDLVILNLIYLGKGVEENVRAMETSQPDATRDEQKTEALQSKA